MYIFIQVAILTYIFTTLLLHKNDFRWELVCRRSEVELKLIFHHRHFTSFFCDNVKFTLGFLDMIADVLRKYEYKIWIYRFE